MDKNQSYRIIVGLFLIPVGIYLYYLRVNYIIWSLFTLAGITLIISGFRYKERMEHRGLTGEARQSYIKSTYFVTSMIGMVVLFIGLGGGALTIYVLHAKSAILWLLVIFVGMIVLFIGRAFRGKAFEANDKAEKQL